MPRMLVAITLVLTLLVSGAHAQEGRSTAGGDAGWARTAGTLGIVTGVVIAGLTVGVVVANDTTIGLGLGIPATLIGAVMIPVVAAGAGSARRGGGGGASGLRLAGWIIYGLALTDACILIGLSIGGAEPNVGLAGSVGALGTASTMFMVIDAYQSASDAQAFRPQVGITRTAEGRVAWTLGIGGRF